MNLARNCPLFRHLVFKVAEAIPWHYQHYHSHVQISKSLAELNLVAQACLPFKEPLMYKKWAIPKD